MDQRHPLFIVRIAATIWVCVMMAGAPVMIVKEPSLFIAITGIAGVCVGGLAIQFVLRRFNYRDDPVDRASHQDSEDP